MIEVSSFEGIIPNSADEVFLHPPFVIQANHSSFVIGANHSDSSSFEQIILNSMGKVFFVLCSLLSKSEEWFPCEPQGHWEHQICHCRWNCVGQHSDSRRGTWTSKKLTRLSLCGQFAASSVGASLAHAKAFILKRSEPCSLVVFFLMSVIASLITQRLKRIKSWSGKEKPPSLPKKPPKRQRQPKPKKRWRRPKSLLWKLPLQEPPLGEPHGGTAIDHG